MCVSICVCERLRERERREVCFERRVWSKLLECQQAGKKALYACGQSPAYTHTHAHTHGHANAHLITRSPSYWKIHTNLALFKHGQSGVHLYIAIQMCMGHCPYTWVHKLCAHTHTAPGLIPCLELRWAVQNEEQTYLDVIIARLQTGLLLERKA